MNSEPNAKKSKKKKIEKVKKVGENYHLIKDQELGHGAYARVFGGYRVIDYTKVAIKIMLRSVIEPDEKLTASLALEIEMSQKIRHQNVVQLFDVMVMIH
jgi:serine/threonine protein kinase